jgi:phage virion morphogenesis protein
MTTFTVTVQDTGVQAAIQALARRVNNMQPVLQSIGERIVERTKRRFDTSTGPDGVPWKTNSDATLDMLAARLGKSYRTKAGGLNKKGAARVAGKKPLIGESGDLRRQIVALSDASSVTVTASPVYAAIQQFGGKAGRGHKVTIPARPFLPVRQDGSLYPEEQAAILHDLNQYLAEGL